jgi:hypothetical protein
MGFCTKEQRRRFLDLCPQVEEFVVDEVLSKGVDRLPRGCPGVSDEVGLTHHGRGARTEAVRRAQGATAMLHHRSSPQ